MNHKTNKKLNNKGFSLVELIIVIAIMAVLIGVLAPQYIRYVEKSRYQTDVTMIEEVKSAIDIALSEPDIYATIPDTATTITFTDTALATGSVGWAELSAEVEQTIDLADTALTSQTCRATGVTVTIVINPDGQTIVNVPAAP